MSISHKKSIEEQYKILCSNINLEIKKLQAIIADKGSNASKYERLELEKLEELRDQLKKVNINLLY